MKEPDSFQPGKKKLLFKLVKDKLFSIFVDPECSPQYSKKAQHWSITWASSIQTAYSHPTSLKAVQIIFYFRTGPPISSLPSGSLTTILYVFLKFPRASYVFDNPIHTDLISLLLLLTLSCRTTYIYMSYRTANLQMLHFIYYSTNIRTEYFKHAAHSPFFFLFKMPFIS